ncbi:MAG: succinate dehydrogenase assembly factor 2 [Burkholderiales bacterium]|nr:succinate dehydrogenase assembly factor 2 [Burkholderiales bacterium]
MAELDRIRWRCRRGLLELDLVLEAFVSTELERMAPPELASFSRLLEAQDNDLWDWVAARCEPPDPALAGLVRRLRAVRHSARG